MRGELISTIHANEILQREKAHLQEMLTGVCQSLAASENNVSSAQSKIILLETEISELREIIQKCNSDLSNQAIDYGEKISDCQEVINSLNKCLSECKLEISEKNNDILFKNSEIESLKTLLEDTRKLLKDRDIALSELQKNIEYLIQTEKQLQIDLARSEHLRLHHETNHTSAQDEVTELESDLQKLREELVKVNTELNHKISVCEEIKYENGQLKDSLTNLETNNSNLNKDLNASRHENYEIKTEINNLKNDLTNINELYSTCQSDLNLLKEQISKYEAEIRRLNLELKLKEDEHDRLCAEQSKKLMAIQSQLLLYSNEIGTFYQPK